MNKFALLTVIAITLVGCGKKEKVQSVDWYKEHADERKEMIIKCKANTGELNGSPNCTNAQQADDQLVNAKRGWIQPNPIN